MKPDKIGFGLTYGPLSPQKKLNKKLINKQDLEKNLTGPAFFYSG